MHVVVCVLGGFVGGAAIGWIAGELKARTGAHEVIVTIMLNYVMLYFLAYLLSSPRCMQRPGRTNPITPPIASNAHLPLLAGSNLRINAGFLIALACAFGAWWLLNRTTTGFEFRAVGANPSAARVAGHEGGAELGAGLPDRRRSRRAGRVGGHPGHRLHPQPAELTAPTGSTRSPWRCSGRGKPGGVVAAGLLFGALHAGSPGMQNAANTPVQIVQVTRRR